MLTRVKTLLGITTNEQDALLTQMIEDNLLLVEMEIPADVLILYPLGLTDERVIQVIVTEMTVERYNKLGAEGMKSETIEGYQKSYESGSLLDRHYGLLDKFIDSKAPKPVGKRLRML